MENQTKVQESEETQVRTKIMELIGNLEAKNLKISEKNKQMLQEVFNGTALLEKTQEIQGMQNYMTYTQAEGTQLIIGLGATFQGGNTINKTFGKMNQTVWMLETLNEVIKEDCELNEDYAQIIKDKDRKIEELNIELEAINKIVDQKNENIQHFEFQISLINQQNQKLEQKVVKLIDEMNLFKDLNTKKEKEISRCLKYLFRIEQDNNQIQIDKSLLGEEISSLLLKLSSVKINTQHNQRNLKPKYENNTVQILRQQMKKSNSFENIKALQNDNQQPFDEPTPRFQIDSHSKSNQINDQNHENGSHILNMTSDSQFNQALTLNRSYLQNISFLKDVNISGIAGFTSTIKTLFKQKPQNQDAKQELWTYIGDLEQEIIALHQKIQQQKDESILDISIIQGGQNADNKQKRELESMVEELQMENQMKVNEISKLEKFNKSLVYTIKNIDENKSKESTLIGNLRGILSPRQFKKIRKYINRGCKDNIYEAGNVNDTSILGDDQINNISMIKRENQLYNYQSFIFEDGDYQSLLKENRIPIADSKSSTMNIKSHNFKIDTLDQNNQSFSILVSPKISQSNQQFFFRQTQEANSTISRGFNRPINLANNNLMLIQDQLDETSFEQCSFNQDTNYFQVMPKNFNNNQQQSMILQNTTSSVEDSNQNLLSTQNNKTLNGLFQNFNNQSYVQKMTNQDEQNFKKQTGNGLFGLKRRQQIQQMNQSNDESFANDRSFNKSTLMDGQNTGVLIKHMQDNFQGQLKELKDEKIKLIQVLNKFLNLPNDMTNTSIDQILNETLLQQNTDPLPSKQYFDDFRLQITQALSKQQLDLSSIQDEKQKFEDDKKKLLKEQLMFEDKRIKFNQKVQKLKDKVADLNKKFQQLEEREKLFDKQDQIIKIKQQAIIEEWARLDKLRDQLALQKDQQDKEWEQLRQESSVIEQTRIQQRGERLKNKEQKVQIEEKIKHLSSQMEELSEREKIFADKEKSINIKERKVERDQERLERMKQEVINDSKEIEKQKDFIRSERERLEQDRLDLEKNRNLSSMFIPDIKEMYKKIQNNKNCKSQNRQGLNKSYINDGEMRIKQASQNVVSNPKILTNMSAYINKCSGEHSCMAENGVFNCDIHKSMNKSTISLSNICPPQNFKQKCVSPISAIGSGRTTYKNYMTNQNSSSSISTNNNINTSHLVSNQSQISLSKIMQRNNSFKRGNQGNKEKIIVSNNYNSTHLTFKQVMPQSTKNMQENSLMLDNSLTDIEDKENLSFLGNARVKNYRDPNLDSILKDTAKFKLQNLRLDESYNSIMDQSQIRVEKQGSSKNDPLAMSFISIENEFRDEEVLRQLNGHSLSRDEL